MKNLSQAALSEMRVVQHRWSLPQGPTGTASSPRLEKIQVCWPLPLRRRGKKLKFNPKRRGERLSGRLSLSVDEKKQLEAEENAMLAAFSQEKSARGSFKKLTAAEI